jgi:hypothetical protein
MRYNNNEGEFMEKIIQAFLISFAVMGFVFIPVDLVITLSFWAGVIGYYSTFTVLELIHD